MRVIGAALLIMAAAATQAKGQGWIDPIRPTPQWGVVKVRTAVNVTVTGRVARVEVEEYFQNRGPAMGESDYLYPLPGEAVFSNFSLYQGDQELRGETMDAGRARGIYEEIVRSKRDPALIELAGHGLLRARVFPIATGETRRITLRYTQLLARAGDALQFRYAAGIRTAPGAARPILAGPDIVRGETSARPRDGAPLTFTLTVDDGSAFRNAFSPTHEIRNERRDGRLLVRPRGELSGDFALFLPLNEAAVGIAVATHKPSREAGYFMLTLSPSQVREAIVPRDITAVIDVSGSMSGEKMQQARAALVQLLESLNPRDRFRLIAFSSDVRSYRPGWTAATGEEQRAARRWVDQLHAEGGTNISGALAEAFSEQSDDGRLPIVLFLTDGLPSVGEQNPERIAQRAESMRGQARVFAFGVGYDVNTYLLDRLSAAARGSTQYVQPGENVEQAVATLATKVRHPVLTDLRLGDAPVRITEVYPRELPDLFSGEELIVFGRYATQTDAVGRVNVMGRRSNRLERFDTEARFPAHENGNDFIPKLWASRKIGALTQQIKLNGQNPELVDEIRQLALRHGLLSEYTSYLVQEPPPVIASSGVVGGRATGNVAAAPPPTAASGRVSVQRAEANRVAREVRSEADLQKQAAAMDELRSRDRADSRVAGGRSFTVVNGVWIDAGHKDNTIISIEPFSAAYFAVLQRLPELETVFKSFDQLLVAGKSVSIKVGKGGSSRLTEVELTRLATQFRAN